MLERSWSEERIFEDNYKKRNVQSHQKKTTLD